MNYTIVNRSFWFGVINAILLSIPLWAIIFLGIHYLFILI